MSKINKLAIIKLSAMGDIIHAMVALQFIKSKYPNMKIDWFVEGSFSKVLQYNPHIDNIYELNLKSIKKSKKELFTQIKLARKYSQNRYDLVIDAQGLIKSAIVSKLVGKKVAGFSKLSIREKFAASLYNEKITISYDKNAIDRNAKILSEPLNFTISKKDILNKKPFLFFKNEDRKIYEFLSNDKKNILLIVGASWVSKMYSNEKFANITNSLNENYLIAWGSEAEKQIANKIANDSSNVTVLPKLDLNNLKALVSKVDLVIGNDTGPTHMAWALNIPSITLFGNTPGYRNTYETNINRIIESNTKVNPYKLDKNDFSIKEIDDKNIVKMAKEILYEEKN